jgi:hypothetical protein
MQSNIPNPCTYGQDIGATALSYLCWALWHLGYVDQAAAVAADAQKQAERLSHPFTLPYTICHACGLMDIFRRSPAETPSYANTVISICTEHDFPFWAAGGQILDGWAISCLGKADKGIKKIDEGLAAWRKTGARLWLPIFLALKAEAYVKIGRSDVALETIDEALAIADETGERWAVAEVLRIKAGLLQTTRPAKSRTSSSKAWKQDDANRPYVGSCASHAILRICCRANVVVPRPSPCCSQFMISSQKASIQPT